MMKTTITTLLLITIWLSSCTKNGSTSTETLNDAIDTSGSKVVGSGVFNGSSGYSVNGKALILSKGSNFSLTLENFSCTNGPDLFVYISKQITPTNIVDLGRLKSTNGNQVYSLAVPININEYKYILIYCKQFSRLFGTAELK